MAMRMVFKMSTDAESKSTTAMDRKTHWRTWMTFSMVWIWAVGDATVATPGFPVNCSVMIEAWDATVR